jgi:hypothetical protein
MGSRERAKKITEGQRFLKLDYPLREKENSYQLSAFIDP